MIKDKVTMRKKILIIVLLCLSIKIKAQSVCYNESVSDIKEYLNNGKISQAKDFIIAIEEMCSGRPTHSFLRAKAAIYREEYKHTLYSKLIDSLILKHPRKLELTRAQIQEIPESINMLTSLTHLKLTGGFEFIPKIDKLKNLTHLNLSGNNLVEFPKGICNLKKLESLNLGAWYDSKNEKWYENSLSEIPECIANLKKVSSINLRDNRLIKLPKSFSRLINILRLDLRNNNFVHFPTEILNSSRLKFLSISDVEIGVAELTRIGSFSYLYELSLRNCKIDWLPPNFKNLKIRKLDLSGNKFKTLPNNLNYSFLWWLNFRRNPILIESINWGLLSKVRSLDMSYCEMDNLSPSTGQLKNVNTLRLIGNKLKELPVQIKNLKSLKKLYLHDNSLKQDKLYLSRLLPNCYLNFKVNSEEWLSTWFY